MRLRPKTGSRTPARWLLAILPLGVAACGNPPEAERERRGPPPPQTSSSAASQAPRCTRQRVDDEVTKDFFEAKIGALCLDPEDGGKSMGEQSKQTLEHIADVFDGEAAVYEAHGITRLTEARYVAESGPVSVQITLSKFKTAEGAFAMFTKRIVGDGDPADEATPKPIDGGALGVGNAYVHKGQWLAEIVYANDETTPEALAKEAKSALPAVVASLASKLPGDAAPPPDVALLPARDRLPLGVRFALGEEGAWSTGAIGYYAANGRRFRVYAFTAKDDAAAQARFGALAKGDARGPLAGIGDEAATATRKDGAVSVDWAIARKGKRVLAVSDEPRAMPAGLADEKRAAITLAMADKQKLLAELVSAP